MNENTAAADPLIASARRDEICRIFGESYDPARWNDWRW
jgi:lysine 2,3-aminomutase